MERPERAVQLCDCTVVSQLYSCATVVQLYYCVPFSIVKSAQNQRAGAWKPDTVVRLYGCTLGRSIVQLCHGCTVVRVSGCTVVLLYTRSFYCTMPHSRPTERAFVEPSGGRGRGGRGGGTRLEASAAPSRLLSTSRKLRARAPRQTRSVSAHTRSAHSGGRLGAALAPCCAPNR